jgi:LCP family protein required for cell wall assembly
MKLRPNSSDPITVEGYQHSLMKKRDWRLLGIGCGEWLFALIMIALTVVCLCGASFAFYVGNPPEQTNILLVRVDADRERTELSARTDSVMVLSIDPEKDRMALFTIPYDTQILSPNLGRLPVNVIARDAELADPENGMDELVDSVEGEFDIDIDYYVRINNAEFIEIVNDMGGVDVDIPERLVDEDYPVNDNETALFEIDAGPHLLDGNTALMYTRAEGEGEDAADRAERQQLVMLEVLHKMASPANVWRLPGALGVILREGNSTIGPLETFQNSPGVALYGREGFVASFVLSRQYVIEDNDGRFRPDFENQELSEWMDEHLR